MQEDSAWSSLPRCTALIHSMKNFNSASCRIVFRKKDASNVTSVNHPITWEWEHFCAQKRCIKFGSILRTQFLVPCNQYLELNIQSQCQVPNTLPLTSYQYPVPNTHIPVSSTEKPVMHSLCSTQWSVFGTHYPVQNPNPVHSTQYTVPNTQCPILSMMIHTQNVVRYEGYLYNTRCRCRHRSASITSGLDRNTVPIHII